MPESDLRHFYVLGYQYMLTTQWPIKPSDVQQELGEGSAASPKLLSVKR